MIDDLATRSALTIAAAVILATGLSVLGLFAGDAVRDAARALAATLSRQFDAIGSLPAEATFRGGEGPFAIPGDLAGASYLVEIRATRIDVISGEIVQSSALRLRVHPFPPLQREYTAESLRGMDISVMVVGPDRSFFVERTERQVDGQPTFLTFAYLPP